MQYSSSYSPRTSPSEHASYGAFPFDAKAGNGSLSPSLGIYASHAYAPNAYHTSPTSGGAATSGKDSKKMETAEEVVAHFEQMKLQRAKAFLEKLRFDVKEGSQWLYTYYRESDKYAGIPSYDA